MLAAGLLWSLLGLDAAEWLPARPLCPFRALTGLPCPGCGMTHALLRLGQMRFAAALGANPFSPILAVLLVMGLVAPGGAWARPLLRYRLEWVALACVLAFWACRLCA